VLTLTRSISQYFEKAAENCSDPRGVANWVMGDLTAALKTEGRDFSESPISPENLAELVELIAKGELSSKLAKEIFPKMWASGDKASAIMEREGLRQITDTAALDKVIDEVIAANPKQVEQYRGGKTAVLGFFVGQVMKATRGQANPALLNARLKERLGG
jgi:aspartyl-tRNA(Asn)/glutamyl-tRNA(Gln) amidotransferase subunit B